LSSRNDIFNNTKTRSGSPFTQSGKINGVNGSILNTERNAYLNENILSYNRNFSKDHRVNAIVGATVQGSRIKTNGSSAQNLPNEALGLAGLDEGIPSLIRSTSSLFTLASFLGRVNYSYKSKYLLTASFRADGSSKFRSGNKWSYFPSAALAWTLGEEKWVKDLNVFSNAKLRLSHGITGNNRVSDFAYLSSIIMPAGVAYSFNNQLVNAAIPSELGNPDLKWETTRQTDLGLDIGFFKQRLSLEIDAYRKTTFDLLLDAKLPTVMGYGSSLKNIGKVQNQGLEFTLNSVNVNNNNNNLTWNTSFNISFNKNKVLELAENQEALGSFLNWDGNYRNLPLYVARVGEPIAMFYGYIWEGNYQYTDFNGTPSGVYTLKNTVTDNGSGRDQVKPGDIKYRDINGDLTVNSQDQVVIGDPNPDFIGGITNNFGYKNFDLNVFFQFSAGADVYNANRLIFEGSGRTQQNMFATYIERWTPENQNNTYYRTNGYGPHSYSSRVVEDGSFIRLKTVQLGYNFPNELTRKIRFKSLRAYLSAQNLYTWTKYQGFDPEVSSRNSALTPAFDYSVYPRARTITFGINVTL
jgi:TonB-linked SusC/RagA family outer membrane protein